MAIKNVGIIGCGLMGSGIAQVSAQFGYDVVVKEVNREILEKGLERIKNFLEKGVEKEKITKSQMDETYSRITGTTEMSDLNELP